MTPEEATSIATMIGSGAAVVAALATVATAIIAGFAASTWRSGLQRTREDECVSAVHNCAALVGRVISLKARKDEQVWPALNEAWRGWSVFRTSYHVVRRYRTDLKKDVVDDGIAILKRLEDYCHQPDFAVGTDGAKINSDFGKLTGKVESRLR